ncbi:hypothetical protein DYB37_013390 [Aphanomyces astaci]|uniref:F-box domain-containing protein n=1 Tax=Aphanomyces astaci TaxID=112090 RepID=A0A3R7BAT1_APHAT|nr:hypothetical protein DYB35_008310 [Aphanomyces astaci]RHZ34015.1 hypothetical protein DYB37_013390 [Aphanomyces astaci]
MQYAAVLSRDDSRGRGGGYSSNLSSSIVALPIKAKKQTKSQRKAAAAAAKGKQNAAQVIQWTEERLGEHVWELCFEYLDVASLCQSKLVCRHFRRLAMLPLPWMHLYSSAWLQHHPHSALPDAYRHCSWIQLWRMHVHRMSVDVKLSTRADVTSDPVSHVITVVNNSMLRSLEHGAVESIRSLQPLASIPCATALHRHVTYFEATSSSAMSLGMAYLPDRTKCLYGFGSDAHVGWHPLSFGYHTHQDQYPSSPKSALPFVVMHTGMDMVTMPLVAPSTTSSSTSTTMWPPELLGPHDNVFGCGYDQDYQRIFFTVNGVLLGMVPYDIPPGNYAAAVSMDVLYASVAVNWGHLPFAFAIEAYIVADPTT